MLFQEQSKGRVRDLSCFKSLPVARSEDIVTRVENAIKTKMQKASLQHWHCRCRSLLFLRTLMRFWVGIEMLKTQSGLEIWSKWKKQALSLTSLACKSQVQMTLKKSNWFHRMHSQGSGHFRVQFMLHLDENEQNRGKVPEKKTF